MSDPKGPPPLPASEKAASPPDQAGPEGRKKPFRKRRWVRITGICVAVILLLIVFLPTILSLGVFRRYILGKVSRKLNGEVQMDSWSLGWFSGIQMYGIKVVDTRGQAVVAADHCKVDAGLLSLLGSGLDLGKVDIQTPRANVVFYPDGTNNLLALIKKEEKRPGPAAGAPKKADEGLGMDIQCELSLRSGEVKVETPHAGKPLLMRDLDANLVIESLNKPIAVNVSASLGEERAPLAVKGSAKVLENGRPNPDAMETDVTLSLQGFQLAGMSGLARQFGSPVDMRGTLNFNLKAETKGTATAAATGNVTLDSLSLSGEALKGDRPSFGRVALDFDVTRDRDKLAIGRFTLDSPVVTSRAAGTLILAAEGKPPSGRIDAEASVDLAEVAARMPNMLRLRKGLRIESGTVRLKSLVNATEGRTAANVTLDVENLAARKGSGIVRLDAPISLTAQASVKDDVPNLDKLELTSSFVEVSGRGNLREMHLELTSDLATATREAAKFVELGDRRATGELHLKLHNVSAGEDRSRLNTTLALKDLALEGFAGKPIQVASVEADVSALANLDKDKIPQSVSDLRAEITTPLAKATLTASRVAPEPGGYVLIDEGTLTVRDVRLGELIAFARNVAAIPEGIDVKGRASLECSMDMAQGVIRAKRLDIRLDGFDFEQDGKHFHQDRIHLSGRATAALKTRQASVRDLVIGEMSLGEIKVARFDVPDWTEAPRGITAEMTGKVNIEDALVASRDFVKLPEKMTVTGTTDIALKVRTGADVQNVNLAARADPLKIAITDNPAIQANRVVLNTVARVSSDAESVTFDKLALDSDLVKLNADGSLQSISTEKLLRLRGDFEYDAGRLSPLLAAYCGQPIQVAGRAKRRFAVRTSLGRKTWPEIMRATTAETSIYVSRVTYEGVVTGPVEMPIRVENGVVGATIDTSLYEGRLHLPILVDCTGPAPLLKIPDNTAILKDVTLKDVMADVVLSRVSPVFKRALVSGGQVGFTVGKLDVPLDENLVEKMLMDGNLSLNEVSLSATPFLKDVLTALHLERIAGVNFPGKGVAVNIKDGRISHSRLDMQVSKLPINFELEGSVGIKDTDLIMNLRVPLTETLLGRLFGRSARLGKLPLGKAAIVLPVRGTVANPRINVRELLNPANLLKNLGVKDILDGVFDIFNKKGDREKQGEPEKARKEEAPKNKPRDRKLEKEIEKLFEGL